MTLPLRGIAAIATRHGKETVLGPALRGLGLEVVVADVDTDAFGTFTRDVPRAGNQEEAARAKARAALAADPHADFGVASEGSFGPHPVLGIVPCGLELVVILARDESLVATGWDRTFETNFASERASTVLDAVRFAERVGAPGHAFVVAGAGVVHKGLATAASVGEAARDVLARGPDALVETDMRAHVNPTRMRSIARAAGDLAERLRSACPACGAPGWGVVEVLSGAPCADCGTPTGRARADVLACTRCGQRRERAREPATASPHACPACNP